MKSFKILALTALVALFGALSLSRVNADTWDKATTVTVNEPVQIPGTVLQPGTYTFTLFDSQSNRHVVQVFNQDRTQLIATVMAIPNYQLQPAGKTILEFAERPTGQPVALEAWFYPGDNFGQEFVYPKDEATQLSQANGVNVPSLSDQDAAAETQPASPAPVSDEPAVSNSGPSATPEPAATPVAEQPAPMSAQDQTPQTQSPSDTASDTSSQPQTTDKQLPKTASDVPLVGLVGLISLGGALTLRRLSRRQLS
jgi:LPXTG cell wall anchor motif